MDDQRFGIVIRAARVKRRLTQREVAKAAGLSASSVSRLERGLLDTLSLRKVRAVAKVLDVRVELLPRSRAADLERVANAAHASLGEAVTRWLSRFPGWTVRPEVGFSHYGDRGVIDLVCWHAARRALLIIELKTELVDINDLLATLDRHARNAIRAVAPMQWHPLAISRLLVIGDSDHNRGRVDAHASLFSASLPGRVKAARAWLRDPVGEVNGLIFFANGHPGTLNGKVATVRRVRRSKCTVAEHEIIRAGQRIAS
ncbi:MAG TPA: helix-turn-helix transcriptional regulator [Candidatus Limnocylindrales bacterium]|nr:helix-turn-helix transcriptional regulator [Candidatus Limnocylindrales bacterium]